MKRIVFNIDNAKPTAGGYPQILIDEEYENWSLYVRFFNEITQYCHPDNKIFTEIRITDSNKPKEYYEKVKQFQNKYPNIIIKNACQFFVKNFHDIFDILLFDDEYFRKNYKICYGLNHRIMTKDNRIGGGYEFVKNVRFVFFDIDKKDHSNLTEYEEKILEKFIELFANYLKKYHLYNCFKVHSGAGIHILYPIPATRITEGRKRWYKEFVKEVSTKMSNFSNIFEVDTVYDFTRVFGLPGSKNIKRNKDVIVLQTYDFSYTKKDFPFKIKSLKEPKEKINNKINIKGMPEIKNSLEWYILSKGAPKGERHQTLIFALKLLLKAKGITDVHSLEKELESIYGGKINLTPTYGTNNKNYSPFIIRNWCKRNEEWCKKNNIVYENYHKRFIDIQ